MQSILIRKYTWAKEQNDNEYYEIVLVSAQRDKMWRFARRIRCSFK